MINVICSQFSVVDAAGIKAFGADKAVCHMLLPQQGDTEMTKICKDSSPL